MKLYTVLSIGDDYVQYHGIANTHGHSAQCPWVLCWLNWRGDARNATNATEAADASDI